MQMQMGMGMGMGRAMRMEDEGGDEDRAGDPDEDGGGDRHDNGPGDGQRNGQRHGHGAGTRGASARSSPTLAVPPGHPSMWPQEENTRRTAPTLVQSEACLQKNLLHQNHGKYPGFVLVNIKYLARPIPEYFL